MVALYDWILSNTNTEHVFLVDFHAVSTAGRKNVATYAGYTSPYVEFESREADRLRLYALLREHDAAGFLELARDYDLDYVVEADAALPEYRFEFEGVTTLGLAMEASGIRL